MQPQLTTVENIVSGSSRQREARELNRKLKEKKTRKGRMEEGNSEANRNRKQKRKQNGRSRTVHEQEKTELFVHME
jgi:hypothetical protein